VILYVDDDEPGGSRDRRAANRLYDSAGFVEIDRLHSYTLSAGPRPSQKATGYSTAGAPSRR
jgi:hypothetical protein